MVGTVTFLVKDFIDRGVYFREGFGFFLIRLGSAWWVGVLRVFGGSIFRFFVLVLIRTFWKFCGFCLWLGCLGYVLLFKINFYLVIVGFGWVVFVDLVFC